MGLRGNDLVDAQAAPQRIEYVDLAVGPGAHQTQVAARGAHDLLGRAAAQDAGGQLAKPLGDSRVVGTAAVVDHSRLGAASLGHPLVLGQLQVRHRTAVGTTLLGFAQIHVPNARHTDAANTRVPRQSM